MLLVQGEFVVAETKEEALKKAQEIDKNITIDNLNQLTWCSSSVLAF